MGSGTKEREEEEDTDLVSRDGERTTEAVEQREVDEERAGR